MTWENVWAKISDWLLTVGIKVLIAIIVMIISFAIINFFSRKISKTIEKKALQKDINSTAHKTVNAIIRISLKMLVVIALVGYVGINTSSITAVIASSGVGIGLALNGALSNLAGGILLLATHPFKNGDYISVAGFEGTVEEILVCNTKIKTVDNKTVYIPNSTVSKEPVINFTEKGIRRLDMTFSISYSADFEKARLLIAEVYGANDKILKDPAPAVKMSAHSESSIDVLALMWVNASDYKETQFYMFEEVKKIFDKNGIEIPFKQIDIHVKTDNA